MEQIPQIAENFLAFYGTRRFTTAFTTARHLFLSWVRSIQSMFPFHFLKINFNIILLSTPGSSKRSPSLRYSHQNHVCTSSLPHTCFLPRPSLSSGFGHLNSVWWKVGAIKFLILKSSRLPFYLVHIRPKYPPQHPILEHPQPMFIYQCEGPSFTPIQNSRQN